MESERQQMRAGMREGEGPDCYLPCREAYLPVVFFKKTFLSGSSYLAPARQLWQGNTLGLIWFVLVVLEMLQLWKTGGWWTSRVTLILFRFLASHLVLIFSCSLGIFLPVSLSSLPTFLSSFIPHARLRAHRSPDAKLYSITKWEHFQIPKK